MVYDKSLGAMMAVGGTGATGTAWYSLQPQQLVYATLSTNFPLSTMGKGEANMIFGSANPDLGGHYNTASGTFTVGADGLYFIEASIAYPTTTANTYFLQANLHIGSNIVYGNMLFAPPGLAGTTFTSTVIFYGFLSKGTVVIVYAKGGAGGSGNTLITLPMGTSSFFLVIGNPVD
jgi:hypothetical protein